MFMLAQLYLRKEDFKTARQLIDKVMSKVNADFASARKALLAQLVAVEAAGGANPQATERSASSAPVAAARRFSQRKW